MDTIDWNVLVSNIRREFKEKGDDKVLLVLDGNFQAKEIDYDNWNGGITYWQFVFELEYKEYNLVYSEKGKLEKALLECFNKYYNDEHNEIVEVIIGFANEQYIDWDKVFPENKATTIKLLEKERDLLIDIATGKSYKDDGIEEQFQSIHRKISDIAKKAGFLSKYPVRCNSLSEWWIIVKEVGRYAERRAYVSKIYVPLINLLSKSEEVCDVNFGDIVDYSSYIRKALKDAELFIKNGSYDSAVDRIHTAFHGYLRHIVSNHGIQIVENDKLPALFGKLITYYEEYYQSSNIMVEVKRILRGAGGIIDSFNRIRNTHTIVHPNEQLIQGREARLIICFISAIINYIEDVEGSIRNCS